MAAFVKEFLLEDILGVPIMLPAEASSASVARRLLREGLRGEVDQTVIDDVELMVSELVGNSVRHGGASCALAISSPEYGILRIAVSDWNQDVPRIGPYDTAAANGRGLQLIDSMSLRWGHDRHPEIGNTVWFEVSL